MNDFVKHVEFIDVYDNILHNMVLRNFEEDIVKRYHISTILYDAVNKKYIIRFEKRLFQRTEEELDKLLGKNNE